MQKEWCWQVPQCLTSKFCHRSTVTTREWCRHKTRCIDEWGRTQGPKSYGHGNFDKGVRTYNENRNVCSYEIRSSALNLHTNQLKPDKDLSLKCKMLKQPEGDPGQPHRYGLREGPPIPQCSDISKAGDGSRNRCTHQQECRLSCLS